MDIFELLRSEGIEIPFILVTGSLGDENAVECLKQGVADYVLKDRLARLPVAIRRALKEEQLRVERLREEDALRSSEASYRSLTQSAPCGILRLNAADGRLLDANAALADMLGYESPATLLKSSMEGEIAVAPEVLSHLIQLGEHGPAVECEVQWNRNDGEPILIRLAGRLLCDDLGAPNCLEMIAENVTERRAAQERIRQLNRLYSVLIHSGETIVRTRERSSLLPELCRIIVEDGGFQMAWFGLLEPDADVLITGASWPPNDHHLEVYATTGLKLGGSISCAIREGRHVICNDVATDPIMAPWRERALQRSFRSLATFPIVDHGQPNGAITIYAGEVNFFDKENVALLDELAANISFALESIETAKARDRASAELHQFFSLSLDLLSISDFNGYTQRMNPAWEKTLGFSPAEFCSRPWVDLVHPEDRPRALQALAGLRAGVEVTNLEGRFLSKSGEYRWLVGSATPVLERGVVFAALNDITSRRNLEDQLRAQNLKLEERNQRIEAANRTKTEFLGNMSHELRSPLNGIIGFSELLYDGKLGALPERPKEFVGRIHASASHLLQLINGLLDLSKIEAGHLEFLPERLLVSQLIHEVTGVLATLAAKKGIRMEIEIDKSVDEVTIDSGRLRQVLYNYLSNALKFTGERGRVVVRLRSEGDTEFRLEVADTGIGVSDADLGRLFVEFQQLDSTAAKRYQGTGLGLAVTKRIVEAQGGRVGVISKPGEGSTFFAILPRGPMVTASPPVAPACSEAARILVIDDHEQDRYLFSQILESSGYLVETAETCAGAYEKCVLRQFDAITLDLMLPDGAGWSALVRIRSLENYRNVPVIVMSGYERSDVHIPLPVQVYLIKPVRPELLVGACERIGLRKRLEEMSIG